MKNFYLTDDLRHSAFSWPRTMLRYEIDYLPDKSRDTLTLDGVAIPYDVETKGGVNCLKVMADLPTYASRKFEWIEGKSPSAKVGEGILSVHSIEGGLYAIQGRNATYTYSLEYPEEIVSIEESVVGEDVEIEYVKTITFANGDEYTFTLKIKDGLDYVEVYEDMSTISLKGSLTLDMSDMSPVKRYALDRGIEKIDDYLKDDGTMPFVINTFAPRVSVWDQQYVSYIAKDNSWTALLLHDKRACDDEEYRIWCAGKKLAFSLYVDKIVAPIDQGKRAHMLIVDSTRDVKQVGSHYKRYYSHVSLDKVKDWVLKWDDSQSNYPKYYSVDDSRVQGYWYFECKGKPTVEQMMNMLDRDMTLFRRPEEDSPVSSRAYLYAFAPTFDMTARDMSDEQFARVRAAMAFTCYVMSDENYNPIDTLMSGHPNFITDVIGTVGLFAALLGDKHPMYREWLEYYEIGIARNLKYHIRPPVAKWDCLGGRWTENIGCYMMGMLHCVVWCCVTIYHLTGGEMPMLYPQMKSLLAFLVNNQNTPNLDDRRLYSPHGSHSCTGEFGGKYGHGFMATMIQLADMCRYYTPLYSEYILHNYRKDEDFYGALMVHNVTEGVSYRDRTTNMGGTSPRLYSCKYTGLGYMLRSHVGKDDEMNVFLQQIDEGPNYRWGRAAGGGCGEIYYYANRRKWTDHSPEDVGDENRGDVQSATNFGVLIDHEFRSVGRGDLTEPLMDFGFAKYCRVNAGDRSKPYYKYRSLMMIENMYINILDAVADKRQTSRFSWAQNQKDNFPTIWQLKPGAPCVDTDNGEPLESTPPYKRNYEKSRIKCYQGQGDFFTVVSHLRTWGNEPLMYSPVATDYGCTIRMANREDVVVNGQAKSYIDQADTQFDGYVGYITTENNATRIAIFDGRYARRGDVSVEVKYDKHVRHGAGVEVIRDGDGRYVEVKGDIYYGDSGEVKISLPREVGDIYLDGDKIDYEYVDGRYIFEVSSGHHTFNIGARPTLVEPEVTRTVKGIGYHKVEWSAVKGATHYEVSISRDLEKTWEIVGECDSTTLTIPLEDGRKYHVRVRAVAIDGAKGEYSHPYPIYASSEVLHQPEGFHVAWDGEKYVADWGEVLGTDVYRLYKVEGVDRLVYEGRGTTCVVDEGEYYVVAVCDIGEGSRSLRRRTNTKVAHWDNRPDLGFVRDTRSNEHGYPGFLYMTNQDMPILNYPED